MSASKIGSRQFTFTADFEWSPPEAPRTVIVYKAGGTYPSLRKLCAAAAKAAGAGDFESQGAQAPAAEDAPVVAPAGDMADELKGEAPQADVAEDSGL